MLSPCEYEFSRGNGTGVAEAIGEWGFCSRQASLNDGGIEKLKCLFAEMDKLKVSKPPLRVIYEPLKDPGAWHVCPSPHECKPSWTFPEKRPFITFNSTMEIIPVSNYLRVRKDMQYPIPGRRFLGENVFTSKWYKASPDQRCIPNQYCPIC